MSVATGENPSAASHEQESGIKPTDIIVGTYQGEDDQIIRNKSEGVYILSADTDSSRSHNYAKTLAESLDQRFNADDPRAAFREGIAEIYQSRDDTFAGLDPDLAAFKLYNDKGVMKAVFLTSGNTDMYVENDGDVKKIKKPSTGDGSRDSAPAIGIMTLNPGDRIIAGSGGKTSFRNDSTLRQLAEDKRHVRDKKPQDAIDYIKGRGFEDVSLIAIDVPKGKSEEELSRKDKVMKKLGITGNSGAAEDEKKDDDDSRRGRMGGLLGAAALGGLFMSKKKRREHRERREQERLAREQSGVAEPIRYSDARNQGYGPVASAKMANADRTRVRQEHRAGSRRVHSDGEDGYNKKPLVLLGLFIGGLALARWGGWDTIPSGEHYWPDALGDGDGIDYSPVEGGLINGPNSIFDQEPDGWLTDDIIFGVEPDIEEPIEDLGLGGVDPDIDLPDPDVDLDPDVTIPDVDPDVDIDPPVVVTPEVPLAEAFNPEYGNGITHYIHDRAHELGIDTFTGSESYEVYERIEQELDAGSLETVVNDDEVLYRMPNGDWGIAVHHDWVEWDTEIQNMIDRTIREVENAA